MKTRVYVIVTTLFVFALPLSAQAAISVVGTPQVGNAINGGNVTLTFDVTPSTGDVVILYGGFNKTHSGSTAIGPSTAGYTLINSDTSSITGFGVWYKVMGASPDSTVVGSGDGDSRDAVAYGAYVLRDFDSSSLQDATAKSAGPTASTNPNAPSITTVTDSAWVMAFAGSSVTDSTPGTVSGYSNQFNATGNDTNDITVAGATFEKTSHGAEDPAAWSSWSTGTWYAVTVAIKPAPAVTAPTVTTDSAESFTPTSASLFGSITNIGGATPTIRGFAYSTDSTLSSSVSTTSESGSFSVGGFLASSTGLTAGQTYYYRAYADNGSAIGYGTIASFTTGNSTPSRTMHLFEGFILKLVSGIMKLLGR